MFYYFTGIYNFGAKIQFFFSFLFLFFLFFFADLNVPLFLALMIEKSIAGKWISWTIAKILHFVNLGSVLLLPIYVINVKYEHIGPGKIHIFIKIFVHFP